jgi:hypothetical protein
VAAVSAPAPLFALIPRGEAVQIEPIKPKLKPPGGMLLKLKCDILLLSFAFKLCF